MRSCYVFTTAVVFLEMFFKGQRTVHGEIMADMKKTKKRPLILREMKAMEMWQKCSVVFISGDWGSTEGV